MTNCENIAVSGVSIRLKLFLYSLSLALLVSFMPAQSDAYKLVELEPSQLKSTINNDSKVKLLYIFTSWCPVCIKALPGIININSSYERNSLDVIFLSLDDNSEGLTRLLKSYNEQDFNVYYMPKYSPHDIVRTLKNLGINYHGSIPYAVLIDSKNQIATEGNYNVSTLRKGINFLLEK